MVSADVAIMSVVKTQGRERAGEVPSPTGFC